MDKYINGEKVSDKVILPPKKIKSCKNLKFVKIDCKNACCAITESGELYFWESTTDQFLIEDQHVIKEDYRNPRKVMTGINKKISSLLIVLLKINMDIVV